MAAKRLTCSLFGQAPQVGGRRIEVIDTMLDSVIYHLVDGLLVDDFRAVRLLDHRPAHAAESEQRYLVA